jgi:glycosyltransferase involved in cell wall biosynthesis
LKILAILPTLRPESYTGKVGGGEISNRILLKGLAELGHSVTVCAITGSNDPESKVRVVFSEGKIFGKFINKVLGLIRFKRLVAFEAKKQKPDVILCGTKGVKIATKEGGRLNVPVGIFIRAFENLKEKNIQLSLKEKCRFALERLFYGDYDLSAVNKVDFLLPNSTYMARVCSDLIPDKPIKVVYPPIANADFGRFQCPREIKKICMVGTSSEKGLQILYALADQFPDISFGIIGDSSVSPGESQVKGNIKRYGWTDVMELLSKESDLLLVPSICPEAFGRVAVEGLIANCLVLVSDIGGLPESVNFEPDLLVEPGDINKWVHRLSQVISSPEILAKPTERARQNAENFNIYNQISSLNKFLKGTV